MTVVPYAAVVPRRARRPQLGIFVAFVIAFALGAFAVWVKDAVLLLRARPAPAVVIASTVRVFESRERDSDGRLRTRRSYAPDVDFRYVVDGVERAGGAVLAGSYEQRGEGWAESIVDRFPPGDSTVAFVDPTDPERAYLVREPSAVPLLFIACPLAVLGLLMTSRWGVGADPVRAPDPSPFGKQGWVLAARDDALPAARGGGVASGLWTAAAFTVVGLHLLLVGAAAAGEPEAGRAAATLWRGTVGELPFVFAVGVIVLVRRYLRRHRRAANRTSRRVGDAHLIVDRPRLVAGAAADATLQLSLLDQRVAMRSAELRLECTAHEKRTASSRVLEAITPRVADGGPPPDALRPATFALPASVTPSSVDDAGPVRTIWGFIATLRFDDGHEVELRFPVRVHAAAVE
jgi:hypothetical protein